MRSEKSAIAKKASLAVLLLAVLFSPARAQWRIAGAGGAPDTVVLPRFEPHISLGTGVIGTSYGDNRLLYRVAPSFVFRPSDRLTVHAGFDIMMDRGLNAGYNLGSTPRSLAPYKNSNGGTNLVSAGVAATFRVSSVLWLSASVSHLGGTYAPFYGLANGSTVGVSATAISAAAAFRFSDDNFLRLSFTFIRDHAGSLGYLWRDAWHGGFGYGGGAFGTYSCLYDYCRMAAPYSSPYGAFGGWGCP